MQTIRFNSTGDDVRVLQQLLQQWGYDIPVTGYFYELTDKFVRDFQTKHDLDVDGIVGRCTWDALMDSESRAMYAMLVTEADFIRNAEELGVDVAAVMAVKEVESSGKGFLAPNKPVILFEGHIFWSQLKDRGINPEDHLEGNEDILYPKWTKEHYKGGIAEYDRLERAKLIDEEAAVCSASWGLFQIMGFNHKVCGCETVQDFVTAMSENEGRHLDLFASFVRNNSLVQYLRDKDWAGFARRYNGPAYAENRYDEKLSAAYEKFLA